MALEGTLHRFAHELGKEFCCSLLLCRRDSGIICTVTVWHSYTHCTPVCISPFRTPNFAVLLIIETSTTAQRPRLPGFTLPFGELVRQSSFERVCCLTLTGTVEMKAIPGNNCETGLCIWLAINM